MSKKNYFFLIFLFFSVLVVAQSKSKFKAVITTWKDDKPAAVSITFDDASYTQYEYAYPVLSKYHFNATFSLVGEWTKEQASYSAEAGMFEIKKMGWQQIRQLQKAGNEIASHGYRHQRYNRRLPLDTLAAQMKRNKTLIEQHTGATCYTIHYPYSFANEKTARAARIAGFRFGRTGGSSYNKAVPDNILLLKSKAVLSDSVPNLAEFEKWLENAHGKWLILMYHHLFPKGSKEMRILEYHKVRNTYSLYPATFDKQMQMLAQKNYWVAPVMQIGKYIVEREAVKLKTHRCFGRYVIKLQSKLDKIYDEPLTIRVKLPWKKVKVKIGETEKIYSNTNGEILLNALPGSKIIIKKKM